jgi:hypothetical protein
VFVRVRNTVTVVCGIVSITTVCVVVVDRPAKLSIVPLDCGLPLAPMMDLKIKGMTITLLLVTLLWIDSTAVVDAGTFVVKRPFPRVTMAGLHNVSTFSKRMHASDTYSSDCSIKCQTSRHVCRSRLIHHAP